MLYIPAHNCQIPILTNIYTRVFPDVIGTFVEVGAHDGENWSNTSCLADSGWTGVYIEPIPSLARMCRTRHLSNKNIRVLNCAVGLKEESIEFYVGGSLSTSSKERVLIHEEIEWAKGCYKGENVRADQLKLETILKQNSINPGFELLVVDVEGNEKEVIESFDIDYWRPKILIIEIEDEHESFQNFEQVVKKGKELRKYLFSKGYEEELYRDQINTVLKRKDFLI